MKAVFIELPAFEKYRENYLDDEGFSQLQIDLMANPIAGDPIEGTGGLRKLRFFEGSFEGRTGIQEKVMTAKRDLFQELTEGFDALEAQRAGKRTLRTHSVKSRPAPKVTARELRKVREDLNLSRGLFAGYLRTNTRTLENWEQGRARPNAQAALLIRLVQRFPDTVRQLAEI